MKKLLFFAVLGFGIIALKDKVSVTPDNQVRVAGWTVPMPASVQNSPVMGMVSMMIRMQTAPQANAGGTRHGAGQPGWPAVPNVTSATNTLNGNASSTAPLQAADQFSAVSKALRAQ